MVTEISWDNIRSDVSTNYGITISEVSGPSEGQDVGIAQSITLPTPVYIFDERENENIRVAQSNLIKETGKSSFVTFTIGYNGVLVSDSASRFIDINGVTLLDGKIKYLKEVSKDLNSDNRIYEVTIYDYAYNLKEGNVNETFDEEYVEVRIEQIVNDNGLNFINLLTTSGTITLEKRTYQDKEPMGLINDLCDALGAAWRVSENNFYLFRIGDFNSSQEINGLTNWAIKEGWTFDMDQKADKVVVRGATITQASEETFTGSFDDVTLARTPVDIEISGLTQTTSNIDGDYYVEDKTVYFDSTQTNPTVKYSYESQLRVEVGDSGTIKVLSKNYVTSLAEARRLGRNYLEVYKDGISSSNWNTTNFDYDINEFNCGEIITVKNRYATNMDGDYIISKIKRQYPRKIEISVGENTQSIYDWQKESKERIEELESTKDNSDYITKDVYKQVGFSSDFQVEFSKLYTVEDSGNILWASDIELSSGGDIISDTGPDEDYPLAYDEDDLVGLPEYHSYI